MIVLGDPNSTTRTLKTVSRKLTSLHSHSSNQKLAAGVAVYAAIGARCA